MRSLLLLLLMASPVAAASPNVLLIFADDLGWRDVGFQGSDFFETPHIDALASRGMTFPNAYSGAGNCAPSRACLLSGTYTPRHGVYAVGSTDRGPKNLMRLIPIPNKSGLAKSNVTIADALKDAGYRTGIFGKWHLSGKDGCPPGEQGFDTVFDPFAAADGGKEGEANRPGTPTDPKGMYSITTKACEFITAKTGKPFFCYLAHHGVHTPLAARETSLQKFKNKTPGKQHSNDRYAACLYDLDDAVGRILKTLDDAKLTSNTLIIFTSDNGGVTASQEPLRGKKGCYYEGGIRIPFVASWPGVIKAGSKCEVPITQTDLFPTFLAATGASSTKVLDGESLLPLFKGEGKLTREAVFWHFPGYLDGPVPRGRDRNFRTRPVSVIRKGDWKLHLYLEEWILDGGRAKRATNHAVELYNLKNDLGERTDLSATNPAKRDELLDDLLKWHESVQATLPTQPNPKYQAK